MQIARSLPRKVTRDTVTSTPFASAHLTHASETLRLTRQVGKVTDRLTPPSSRPRLWHGLSPRRLTHHDFA
uniref:Uncharacterized protein n=1 Tax=Oryza sativa subsp. japonica TaxID=39947 RepID=Q6H631_ORYSJ|nr:hypothetical protein [Oryza sativa Japonica Group]BAD25818.1 hypothetical protein [Oryza sativa Japonica Group]